ncbi:hypothetical protein ACF0H5_008104 [Mactra antiquata]
MWSVILVCCLFGISHGAMIEWTSQDYPNPQEMPELCGRYTDTPSYVCDPNGLISKKSADFLDHILLSFQNDTKCPCSAYSCERRQHSKGYIIAIALMRKIKRPDNVKDTPEAKKVLVHQFASDLRLRLWNSWATCDELIVIAFSKEDGILTTVTGSAANRVLSYNVTMAIQTELARFFRTDGNIGQGLHYLTLNYRRVLDGYDYYPIMYGDVPIHSGAAGKMTIAVLTCIITTILLNIFC